MNSRNERSAVPPVDVEPGSVFISHASENEDVARRARKWVRARGGRPYLAVEDDGRGLPSPAAVLNDALDRCDRILVIWSHSASNAPWVRHEWTAFWKTRGAEACDIMTLDDTPLPVDVEGTIADAPADWKTAPSGARARGPSRPPARSVRPTLYITTSLTGVVMAERIAARVAVRYEVVRVWATDEETVARRAAAEPGDWILVAADKHQPPFRWELSFDDDPDRHARRLVLVEPGACVPSLLRLSDHVPVSDSRTVDEWLAVPRAASLVSLLLVFRSTGWRRLSRRLHDGLSPVFASIDPRLGSIDPRLRRRLYALRAAAFIVALVAHAACIALTTVVPSCGAETTRRNLVLDAVMVMFSALIVEMYSVPAAVAVAVHAGWLGAIAVLLSGVFTRAGAPGVAFGAGVALAAVATSEQLLAPPSRYLRRRPRRAAVAASVAVLLVAAAVAGGLLLLSRQGDLGARPACARFGLGLVFGVLGGGATGGALAWMRSYLLRGRDRHKALHPMAWGAIAGAPAAAIATVYSVSDADKPLDGLGIGLFCGALVVALWLAPSAAMRRFTGGRWLPLVSCCVASGAVALAALPFKHVQQRYLILPCLLGGLAIGAAIVGLSSRQTGTIGPPPSDEAGHNRPDGKGPKVP